MIPKRLRLHNFLSYRDCEVDFSGLHIAVLTGKNGEGKSALLDAMTWAVWGEGRGRTEDDRIRLGAAEMQVEFAFRVAGQDYLIIRKRTRGRGGEVHAFAIDPELGRKAITGGTSRETQEEINRRIGMDYQTFANSAFVAQGHAGEFTRQGAAERKEVFRKILGMELYEELSVASSKREKDAKARLDAIEREVREKRETVAEQPRFEAEAQAARDARATIEPKIAAAEGARDELHGVALEFDRLQRDATATAARAERTSVAVVLARTGLAEATHAVAEAEQAMDAGPALELQHNALIGCRARDAELQKLESEARPLRDAILKAEARAQEARARVEASLVAADRRVAELTEVAARLEPSRAKETALRLRQADIDGLRQQAEEHAASGKNAGERRSAAKADANNFREEALKLKEKAASLEGQPQCPICRKPLSASDLDHVQGEYAAQRKQLGERFRAAQATEQECIDAAARAEADRARLATEADRAQELLRQADRAVHAELRAAEEAASALPPAEGDALALRVQLESGIAGQTFLLEAKDAQRQLAALEYSEEEHAAVRGKLGALDAFESEYRAFRRAADQLELLKPQLERAAQEVASRSAEEAEALAASEAAATALATGSDVGPLLTAAETELANLRAEDERWTRQAGNADGRLAVIRDVRARLEMALDEVRAQQEEQDTFRALTRAFGRDGIQAMLIEQAIPEVEHVANAMLERMTEGRIQIQLATQRITQAKVVKETLDIRISDDLGTRDYEMYSGGEAFRVDFALRIALAKLLASTKGAGLPTLIIDEGFGSQDSEGIDRLVDALQAIREDFELILVVTHVDEMKERFERRIEVTKDAVRGSTARVV